jgi:HD-GYP domain-containing protein (c-di-GMP phosphodiesterase class II)
MEFVMRNRTIQWRRIFVYLVGLFFILDFLYGGYFLFPELAVDLLEWKYIIWLDGIAVISSGFAIGYMKLSFSEAKEVEKKMDFFRKLQSGQEDIIIALAEITEAKSGETGQHIRRVAEYSRILGMRILKDVTESEQLRVAAMMHDLGKLLIDQNILEKKGKLTEEEYEIVKRHSQFGWNLLEHSKGEVMEMARVIALQHHEKWDGSGYPKGLRGNEISIYAQIVAVADVYDALTSKRSYKDAWAASDAKQEIIDQKGEQFSPAVVDAFLACYGDIERIRVRYMDKV